jgi:ElaB/YqjD/DUF883 family membrane-anchored ribosome-binding protein
MSTLTSLLDDKASRIAERVDDLGRETAEGLHAAASTIRKGSKAIEDVADSTANKLDGAGSYVEKHNVKRMLAESRQLVRRYPGESLALAGGVCLVLGFAIRRLTHTCAKSARNSETA